MLVNNGSDLSRANQPQLVTIPHPQQTQKSQEQHSHRPWLAKSTTVESNWQLNKHTGEGGRRFFEVHWQAKFRPGVVGGRNQRRCDWPKRCRAANGLPPHAHKN